MPKILEIYPDWLVYFDLVNQYVIEGYDAILRGVFNPVGQLMNQHQEVERKMSASTK
jgi:hypothetical protein